MTNLDQGAFHKALSLVPIPQGGDIASEEWVELTSKIWSDIFEIVAVIEPVGVFVISFSESPANKITDEQLHEKILLASGIQSFSNQTRGIHSIHIIFNDEISKTGKCYQESMTTFPCRLQTTD